MIQSLRFMVQRRNIKTTIASKNFSMSAIKKTGLLIVRRLLMHVPPKRFVRIRHYGLLSCRNKSKKMTHCRNLLGCKKYISALKNRSATEMIKLLYNIDVCRCSSCGGKMVPHLPDKHTPSVLAHMRC